MRRGMRQIKSFRYEIVADMPGENVRWLIIQAYLAIETCCRNDDCTYRAEEISEGSRMDGATILIVEDHQPTASVLQRLLRASNHETSAVNTIADARRLIHSQQFDLVITDLHLVDGNILPFMPELLERQRCIIAVTGSHLLDPHDCKQFGFTACLRKPIAYIELESAVEAAIQSNRQQNAGPR